MTQPGDPVLALALRFLDAQGDLSVAELDALAAWLAEDTRRARWLSQQLRQHDLLDRILSGDRQAFLVQLGQRQSDALRSRSGSLVRRLDRRMAVRRPLWQRPAVGSAGLAALLLCSLGMWLLFARHDASARGAALWMQVQGEARRSLRDGEVIALRPGAPTVVTWISGARLEVAGTGTASMHAGHRVVWQGEHLSATAGGIAIALRAPFGDLDLRAAQVETASAPGEAAWIIAARGGALALVAERDDGSRSQTRLNPDQVGVLDHTGDVLVLASTASVLALRDDVIRGGVQALREPPPEILASQVAGPGPMPPASSVTPSRPQVRTQALPFALDLAKWPVDYQWTLRPAGVPRPPGFRNMPSPFSGNCWDARSLGQLAREDDPVHGSALVLRNQSGPLSAQLLFWIPFVATGPGTVQLRLDYQTQTGKGFVTLFKPLAADGRFLPGTTQRFASPGTRGAWRQIVHDAVLPAGEMRFTLSIPAASRHADEPLRLRGLNLVFVPLPIAP